MPIADGKLMRIIPARAGFTRPERSPPTWGADHPRSRGVYAVTLSGRTTSMGSSPLARGLLQVRAVPGLGVGIIPARAGFTGRLVPGRSGSRDHPRSRGVYPSGDGPLRR